MSLYARLSNPKVEPEPKPRKPEWLRRRDEELKRKGRVADKELVA